MSDNIEYVCKGSIVKFYIDKELNFSFNKEEVVFFKKNYITNPPMPTYCIDFHFKNSGIVATKLLREEDCKTIMNLLDQIF